MDRKRSRTPLVLVLLALCATASAAQEFRGAVTGRVTDSSGLVVPGATVTVMNTATGVAATATTNETGSFTVPYLTPGSYTVAFELTGFYKVVRSVELRVGDRLEVDATLQPGAVAETVSVTAQVPLLETTTGSAGQVIDEKTLASLPLADGNPFILARFAVGVTYYGDLKFSRPFDNAGTSQVVADGAPGGNEFMIDGSPNEANKSGGLPRVAYVPSADSVQAFKVESASFDAQQGHTAGATVNVVLKSGTNSFKGDVYGYWRNDKLAANDFFLNRTGTPNPGLDYKHWGGTLGGPIVRSRTFFFGAPAAWHQDLRPGERGQTTRRQHRPHGVRQQRHSTVPAQPGSAELPSVLSLAESGRRRSGPEQLLQPSGADRHLLYGALPCRSRADPGSEVLRALLQESPHRGSRELVGRDERHSCDW